MRQVVRSFLCGLFLAGGVLAGGVLAGGALAGDGGSPPSAESAAVPAMAVLFAPSHPVFLRLRMQVDGQSLSRFRERATAQWFRRFDQNHDGFLDKAEIAEFLKGLEEPTPAMRRRPVKAARGRSAAKAADRHPVDAKVSLREFRALVDRRLGPPLALSVRMESGSEVDASLFRHLDLNGDGVLTLDELQKAKASLAPLDADDDETISTAELLAASRTRGAAGRSTRPEPAPLEEPGPTKARAGTGSAERLPFMILGPDTPAEAIAAALLREYGSAATKGGGRWLNAGALGVSSDAARRIDANGADKLGLHELARWLVEIPPQLELSFQLFDQQHGRARVSVIPAENPPTFEWQQSPGESGMLVVNGLKVALSAKRTRGATGDMSSFYALRFNIFDQDKNNYLDRREFGSLGLPGADFAAVDANGDGQITPAELNDYLKQQGNVLINQVVIAVSDESQSLFEFLDTRPDGRLSPRELNAAAGRLQALDRNRDGNLTLGELRTQIRLEAEVKRPAEPRPDRLMIRRPNESAAPLSPDRGPEWFRRMDRNYDGDVSWREFLGSRAAFDRLDTDHDGLLSPEEAEHAR